MNNDVGRVIEDAWARFAKSTHPELNQKQFKNTYTSGFLAGMKYRDEQSKTTFPVSVITNPYMQPDEILVMENGKIVARIDGAKND